MKRRTLALVLTLSLLLGMTMALPAMAAEETTNLLAEVDADFESGDNEGNSAISTGMAYVNNADDAQSGNWYIAVPAEPEEGMAYGVAILVDVQGSTTYTVSFWVRSSMTKSGRILIRNMVGSKPYSTWASETGTTASVFGTDITERFGHVVEEGQERSGWYEVKKSFTTAPETTRLLLQVYSKYNASGAENDQKLCLDNFSLVEGTENLLRNGEMNVNLGGTAPDYWTAYNATSTGVDTYGVEADPAAPDSGNMVYKSGTYYQLYQNVVLPKGQYKLSTRFYGPANSVANGGATSGDYKSWSGNYSFRGALGSAVPENLANTWVTYTTYFTAPVDGKYAVGLGYRWETKNNYYDDVVLLPAEENTVEYVTKETADVVEKPQNGNATSVRGNAVGKISDLTASENAYTLTAVGHYVAKDVTATEKFTLVSAVYQKNKNTQKTMLHSIAIKDGESAPITDTNEDLPKHNTENIMADISVPVADDTYTYEVRSYLWSSASGMQPVGDVCTLAY